MNAIHIVCPYSKYCSARSEVSQRSHPQVGLCIRHHALNNIPANIVQTLPYPSSQNLFVFGSQPPLSISCLRTPQKSSIGWSYGTATEGPFLRWRGWMGVSALILSTFPLLPLFQLWPNSGCLIPLYVLTAASLTILPTKDLSAFILTASFIEVTDGLDEPIPLLFWHYIFSARRRPLSAFLCAVFLVFMHWHTQDIDQIWLESLVC